ncbi:MAG: 50S ribosomal protein L15 [Actinomycetota bacterium]|nr:50S ribosomal protein L15 [Actinomycetota bacterium]
MKLHDLAPPPGSKRPAKRVARGIGGRGGKTAGRGTKGQRARDTVKPGFEGGQLPLTQRVPKLKGFKNPFKVSYHAVNLQDLDAAAEDGAVTPAVLRSRGFVHAGKMIKILGEGEVRQPLRVEAHAFSAAAERAITAAGGSVVVLPAPFGGGRPPAKGNALTNR